MAAPTPRQATTGTARPSVSSSSTGEGRFLAGTLLAGRYRVIGLLGQGGMGEVYRATDLTLGQSVALKFLPEEAARNESLLQRFHNEVRVARQVSHPNVCRVYDIGEAEGVPFISMEYVDGEDLASLLHRIGRLSSDKALEVARKLCAGVSAAHERGIIHRDLKPHNIMLNKRGEVVVMDFGLAAIADQLEGAEARNGTPQYMSPEQLRGDVVTFKSDLYAIGLIVYEVFTGRRAYDANTLAELLRAEETAHPASLTSMAGDLDPSIERIVLRCLNPDPLQRPASALAVSAALPGGDPLAAALAAGEIPSPELVAAGGKREGFPAKYAIPCLILVLLGLLSFPFMAPWTSMLAMTPMDYPPDVLNQKARELVASLRHANKPLDTKSWFAVDTDMVSYFRTHAGAKDWAHIFAMAAPVGFYYRESPQYLASPPDGEVSLQRPALNAPMMTNLILDSQAHLRMFESITEREGSSGQGETRAFDPAPVFEAAGLDMSRFEEISPSYVPPVAFDARRAWSGLFPGLPDLKIGLEMSSWRGNLVSFYIRWPWSKPALASHVPAQNPRQVVMSVFTALSIATGLFFVVSLAVRNLRKGRGDRRGAARFATAVFCASLLAWIGTAHIIPSLDMIDFLVENIGIGMASALLMWLLYIALEPAVRSRWPHSLITWNRLVAGQLRDPRLGSHLLLGVTIAVFLRCVLLIRWRFLITEGLAPLPPTLALLNGARAVLGSLGSLAHDAMVAGPAIFGVLCAARVALRRDSIAALSAALLMAVQQEPNVANSTTFLADITVYTGLYAVLAFILLRMGLVPAIVTIFVMNTLSATPLSGDFSAWYNAAAVSTYAIIASLAVYGFVRSQAKSPETGAMGSR